MSKLANMFSALCLDAEEEDDRAEVPHTSSTTDETAASKPDKNEQNDTTAVNYEEAALVSSSGDYRMPLVWIDLEMTGLDITKDRILEIACIITDGKLTKQIEGPDLVISQSKDCLDNMGEWCKTQHAASGLTERVLQSELSEHDAEAKVLDFVRKHINSGTPLLAGNSVYVDLLFLKKYMPQLAAVFSHVIVDVSSIMALCIRWYPKVLPPPRWDLFILDLLSHEVEDEQRRCRTSIDEIIRDNATILAQAATSPQGRAYVSLLHSHLRAYVSLLHSQAPRPAESARPSMCVHALFEQRK